MARILERGITLIHRYSRNKSDYVDFIYFSLVFLSSFYKLKTVNQVRRIIKGCSYFHSTINSLTSWFQKQQEKSNKSVWSDLSME